MVPVLIRKATEKDFTSVQSLADELALSDLPYDKQVNLKWANTKDGIAYFQEKISGKSGACFVAETEKIIVGYATCSIKNVESYRLAKVAEIENLIITASFQNKGIGKKLLTAFFAWAKEMGANKVSVSVYTENTKGIEFYKSQQFQPYDITLEKELDQRA